MKILWFYKPEKCVSKVKENDVLKHFFLEKANEEKGVLNASDGKMLIRIPVDLAPGDTAGAIPVEALLSAKKVGQDGFAEIRLAKKCEIETPDTKQEFSRFNYLKFPNFQKVIPISKPKAVIAFDVKKLKAISDAIYSEGVVLEIRGKEEGIVVRPASGSAAFGVLMPIKPDRETPDENQKEI